MSFGNINVINNSKCWNFINSENASVIVVAMERSYRHQDLPNVWLIQVQVSGRLFGICQNG